MDIANICVRPGVKGDRWEFFLHNSSINTCRERIKYVASCNTEKFLERAFDDEGDTVVRVQRRRATRSSEAPQTRVQTDTVVRRTAQREGPPTGVVT